MGKGLLVLLSLAVSSCMSPMERRARDFVRADAENDAWSTAAERCGGDADLIDGRKGYSPSDYRCLPQGEIPRAYACAMDNGSTIVVTVLTDMSGEVRDGEKVLRLRYPTFQSNHNQVLVGATWPTQPYMYALSSERMELARLYVSPTGEGEPTLNGRCKRQ